MARAAFASWNNRIAPVFDVSRSVQLVVTEKGKIIQQNQMDVHSDQPNLKAGLLAELEIDILVCGAISRSLKTIIGGYGIKIIPFVSGGLAEMIQAWTEGKLVNAQAYAMPGCQHAAQRSPLRGFRRMDSTNSLD